MLTIKDLLKLQKVISETVDEKLKEFYDRHIKYLPTKNDFFTRMDQISGEIKAVRQEQTIHADEHRKINDRFDRIDHCLHVSTAE